MGSAISLVLGSLVGVSKKSLKGTPVESAMTAQGHAIGFQNCPTDISKPIELEVEGTLPDWLVGTLFRAGPGIFDIEAVDGSIKRISHWFDGLTVMHRFEIHGDGRVTYTNKNMAKSTMEAIANKSLATFQFGIDPCKTMFHKFQSVFTPGDVDADTHRPAANIGVTVGLIPGQSGLFNKTDAASIQQFDPNTLEELDLFSYQDINPAFEGQLAPAHTHFDKSKKEFFSFAISLGLESRYNVFCIPENEPKGYLLASIVAKPAYIHSFAMTENYIILVIWPLYVNPIQMLWNKSIEGAMAWVPSDPVQFHVISRSRRAHIATYEHAAFYAFHHLNSYEENGDVIIDITTYPDAQLVADLRLKNLRSSQPALSRGRLQRFTLQNINKATLIPQQAISRIIFDHTVELARLNFTLLMKKYTYAYGLNSSNDSMWNRIIKINVENGEASYWHEEGMIPAEPIFFPSPNPKSEDDGVLLSIVLDTFHRRSFLLVLNATTLRPIAKSVVPHVVPFGFHGNYYPVGTFPNSEE